MQEKDFLVERLVVGEVYSNAYLVYLKDEDRALLIDAGGGEKYILRALGKQGAALTAILLTHGHFDHILAAGAVREETGAKIVIHSEDEAMLASEDACLYPAHLAHTKFTSARADAVIRDDGQALPFANVRALHTPGHTPGSVCYYFEDEGILFTGDTLFQGGFGRTDLPGGDEGLLATSLKRLFALPEDVTIYPGHGEPSTIGRERDLYAL